MGFFYKLVTVKRKWNSDSPSSEPTYQSGMTTEYYFMTVREAVLL